MVMFISVTLPLPYPSPAIHIHKVIFYPMFDNFFLLAILANAMALAVDYAGAGEGG